jgi:hypothetical protein
MLARRRVYGGVGSHGVVDERFVVRRSGGMAGGVCDGGGRLHDGIDRVQMCVAFRRGGSGDGAGLQSCAGKVILGR